MGKKSRRSNKNTKRKELPRKGKPVLAAPDTLFDTVSRLSLANKLDEICKQNNY